VPKPPSSRICKWSQYHYCSPEPPPLLFRFEEECLEDEEGGIVLEKRLRDSQNMSQVHVMEMKRMERLAPFGKRFDHRMDGEESLLRCDVDNANSVGCGRLFFHEKKWRR
jgi:hypothetical protein